MIRHIVFRYTKLQVDGGINGHDKGFPALFQQEVRFKSPKLDTGDHVTDLGSPDTYSPISLNNSEFNRTNLAFTMRSVLRQCARLRTELRTQRMLYTNTYISYAYCRRTDSVRIFHGPHAI